MTIANTAQAVRRQGAHDMKQTASRPLTKEAKKGRKNMLTQSRVSRNGVLGDDGGVGDDKLFSS